MTFKWKIIFAIFMIHGVSIAKGQRCKTSDGRQGRCISQFECRKHETDLKICKYLFSIPFVCCPEQPLIKMENEEEKRLSYERLQEPTCGVTIDDIRSKRTVVDKNYKFLVKRYIVGGTDARQNAWPWMAAIYMKSGRKSEFTCGGIVINKRYILTAAHCFINDNDKRIDKKKYVIELGELNLSDSRPGEKYFIEDLIIHQNYDPPIKYNDIALIRTSKEIKFNWNIKPICLPLVNITNLELRRSVAVVIGWGSTSYGGRVSDHLQKTSVFLETISKCRRNYSRIRITEDFPKGIISSQICAGVDEGGRDACQGDSGGPLMVRNNKGEWSVIGIVSSGFQCARPNFPGIYTRVSSYLNWMSENIDLETE